MFQREGDFIDYLLKEFHDMKVFVRDEKTVVWRYVRKISMNYN